MPSDDANWTVTSEGGREHFVIMVSPTADDAVDAVVEDNPRGVGGSPE